MHISGYDNPRIEYLKRLPGLIANIFYMVEALVNLQLGIYWGGHQMNPPTEIQSIWQYKVQDEYTTDFIKAYAPDGDWARLFQQCPGYIKTELKQDIDNPQKFVTMDFWQSRSAFSAMKETISDEYDKLDIQCEAYTVSENHIGFFSNE